MSAGDRPDPEQMRVFARLSAAEKLALVERLREEALSLKKAWLREQHPSEDDATIQRRLRAWMIHGSTRLD